MTHRPQASRRATRLVALVAVWATALAGVAGLTVTAAPGAVAADLSQFDPGQIISDSIFYDSTTMTAAQIRSFLATKGANCVAASGNQCLKDYTYQPSGQPQSRPADAYCKAYEPAAGDTAAQIISKVATACGINPQVLIVMLQKEQGLITASSGGTTSNYQKAMGYGCPDTAACDTTYYGFSNQVYSAARQFQRYAAGDAGSYRPGMTNTVLYNPNRACGSSPVLIQNQATASLYDYTPYQPNAAALAAGYGTAGNKDGAYTADPNDGDCASYGNRNFWNYFSDWFGSPVQRIPVGSLDTVSSSTATTITVAGWAVDPDTSSPIAVHVYVDGNFAVAATADASRADVGAALGKGDNHGFTLQAPTLPGTHTVCVYAIDASGRGPNPQLGCGSVTVVNRSPTGSLDNVAGTPTAVTLAGWAVDPDTTASVTLNVFLDGKLVGAPQAGSSRPDVGAALGKGDNHGFNQSYPAAEGSHTVCVYVIDALGQGPNPLLGCRSAQVVNHAPTGSVDAVTASPTSITVTGWALDPDSTGAINVHVYIDDGFVAAPLANAARPDVGAALGKGDNHGFASTYPVAEGTHTMCLYAIDAGGKGPNPQLACRTVRVVNHAPIGSVDTVTASTGSIALAGWALDPDTTAPISVHVYVDGQFVAAAAAGDSRADVGTAFGKGDSHGFNLGYPLAAGDHQVCVYAIDATGQGPNPQLACRNVTVG